MKLSLNWLKDYVSVKLSNDELVHRLTMLGLEVEKVHSVGSDTVFELEITPNRPDCLNVIGIAREVSAGLNVALKTPLSKKTPKILKKVSIQVLDKQACRRYIGTIIENVQMAPSTSPIKERLNSIGSRLINNVVDITNFTLMEVGQPLHAFDYDKLAGGKIIVRRAKKGEKIITIDGVTRELDESILVIADEVKAVAIAGIMGGKETEVTNDTKNILLESAWFDPILIRRASRKLGLSSDSSYRFERGIDYQGVERGSSRAAQLILSTAKGKITAYADVALEKAKKPVTIVFDITGLNEALGSNIQAKQCRNILTKLGCAVIGTTSILRITPPSFRNDLKAPVDLIEEIARVVSFDKLPESLPLIKMTPTVSGGQYKFKKLLRNSLTALGLSETITFTMYNRRALEKSNLGHLSGTRIKNPLSADQEIMRPSLLPSLLNVVLNNFNQGQKDLQLFEIGKTYIAGKEKEMISIIMTGSKSNDWRLEKKQGVSFYDTKGIAEGIINKLNDGNVEVREIENVIFENDESVELLQGETKFGILGKVKNDVLQKWDIKSNKVFYAELYIEELKSLYKEKRAFQSIAEFPSVQRDISLAVKDDVKFSQIKSIATKLGSNILNSVTFTEEYLGDKIPAGYRGVVFSLNYQSPERTLKEDEVNSVHETISQALIKDLQAIKR